MDSQFYDLHRLRGKFQRKNEIALLSQCIERCEPVSVEGIFGGTAALICAAIAEKTNRPLLLVLPGSEQIDKTLNAIKLFTDLPARGFPALQSFPQFRPPRSRSETKKPFGSPEISPDFDHEQDSHPEDSSPEDSLGLENSILPLCDDLFGQRLELLKKIRDPKIIVSAIDSLLFPVPGKKELLKRTKTIKVGSTLSQEDLIRWLLKGTYHRTSAVDLRGEFAVRGSLVDVFAPDWEQPVRIEFFGDEIESIRRFDLATQRSLESLKEIGMTRIRGDECFHTHFADLLDSKTVVVMVDHENIEPAGRKYLEQVSQRNVFHRVSEVLKNLMCRPLISLANLPQGFYERHFSFPFRSVERLQGALASIKSTLDEDFSEEICIVCPTESEIKRLKEAFGETRCNREGRLNFSPGFLSEGFQVDSTLLIGSGQMFSRTEIHRPRRRQLGQVIDSFLELKPGDLVVHVSHGIARFRGLKTLTRGLQEEEHLELEFANNASVFVPSSKISLVQKYVGGTKSKPPLAKLGGASWARHKKSVQEAVFDLAVEMLDLQAARTTFPGISYPEDTDWQVEFDAAFPYRETEDQLVAIDAIKSDMQLSRPMDRLICGDVGFGKTEVAMRAAFKAVDAGYQVAVLVPTTVLAEQHYRTFSQRMGAFPFTIAPLSRFQSKREQAQTLENLALGAVDIVIGTHRIVSKDVKFHNLGLVIIDEEQRFGVDHKERLKKLRQSVDILTLTATPIPRTLHFSLLGLRDISNLETPPEDRMAVETRLVRYHPDLIRKALLRELSRGGQAFFVHNRVKDIEETAKTIQRVVPEARIGIGHAQMNEHELESIMRDFVQHEFDVLVCTTIIESGLDIPNANTIFIDRADRYGLADLHQLRGRVGRYKNQAYCFLLIDANQPITAVAAKRLRAIEEFSHLGAGFNLAMRDLEIRGAGNILGTQQSGHIAVVGYEMYCQFLEGAVRTLKQMPPKTQIEVEIDLPGRAMIPPFFISNQRMKIDLYRRIVRISNESELQDIREEIIDRFGKPPREVLRLLIHARIRIAAHYFRIRSIHLTRAIRGDAALSRSGGYIVMEYVSANLIEELRERLRNSSDDPPPIRLTEDMKAYIPMPISLGRARRKPDEILVFICRVFSIPSTL